MALSKTRLTAAIVAALDTAGAYDTIDAADRAAAKADSELKIAAITDAIVDEFIANATVTVAANIPVSTAGTAAAQTGATTAPGTGGIS